MNENLKRVIYLQFYIFSFVSITILLSLVITAILGNTKEGIVIIYMNRSNEMILEFILLLIMFNIIIIGIILSITDMRKKL